MKIKFLKILLFVFLSGVIVYFFASETGEFSIKYTPCDEVLTFYVDTVDSRFGVSPGQVKQAFQEGAEAWAKASGKQLAVYDEEGDVPIRLLYDERQQLVDSEFTYREQIKSEELRIESLQKDFLRDSLRFEQRMGQYEQKARDLQQKIDDLNSWVTRVNNSGGFRENDSELFDKRKDEIDRLQRALSGEDRELKSFARQLNAKIDRLNRMIEEKNRMIDRYNENYSGYTKFAQGTYERTGNRKVINIHQFSGLNELRLVLTHELGHAFGLGHVQNPQSVMYPEMTRQPRSVLHLTDEDTAAILELCGA